MNIKFLCFPRCVSS